jgi:hypothetical protein
MAIPQRAMLRAAHLGRGLFISCTNESFRPRGVGQQLTEGIEIARDLNRNYPGQVERLNRLRRELPNEPISEDESNRKKNSTDFSSTEPSANEPIPGSAGGPAASA